MLFTSTLLAFAASAEAFIEFDCVIGTTEWKYIGSQVQCKAQNLFALNRHEEIRKIGFIGNQSLVKHVQIIDITKQTCNYLPKDWEDFFKANITGLKVSQSQLLKISAADLKPFAGLVELLLSDNSIDVLPSDLFRYTSDIQHLNLAGNLINIIGPRTFDSLTKLIEFDMSHNECIDEYAKNRNSTLAVIKKLNETCEFGVLRFSWMFWDHQDLHTIFCMFFLITVLTIYFSFKKLNQFVMGVYHEKYSSL